MFGLSKSQIQFIITWYKACFIATLITIGAIALVALIFPDTAHGAGPETLTPRQADFETLRNFNQNHGALDECHTPSPEERTGTVWHFESQTHGPEHLEFPVVIHITDGINDYTIPAYGRSPSGDRWFPAPSTEGIHAETQVTVTKICN